jgi:DNA polymerase III epsilon subunit-like protein
MLRGEKKLSPYLQQKGRKKMKKIDKRVTKYVVLDTETANSIDCPLVYDVGFEVIDSKGRVYEKYSFTIADVYCNEKELMKSAYYADKLPQYEEEMANGERKLVSLATAKKILAEVCREYNVKAIMAHNARFDYRSATTTQRYITKSANRYFFPYGVEIWDTLEMAKSVVKDKPTYKAYCERNGFVTKNGKPKLTAEVLYRFISGNDNFVEHHKGIDDVEIEKEIFVYCKRQHKKMKKSPWAE